MITRTFGKPLGNRRISTGCQGSQLHAQRVGAFFFCLFLFLFFWLHLQQMWKFPGPGIKPCHSSDPEPLQCQHQILNSCTTRELLQFSVLTGIYQNLVSTFRKNKFGTTQEIMQPSVLKQVGKNSLSFAFPTNALLEMRPW